MPAFLAVEIEIKSEDKELFKENFTRYNLDEGKVSVTNTFLPPSFIERLFPAEKFLFHIEADIKDNKKILLSRVMDDRMFFLCWYGNTGMTNSANARCYKNWDWWYAFIFGDKEPKSIANTVMQEEHLLKHTYARWADYGTLYGMSIDSFVCLSPERTDIIEKHLPQFDVQMNSMYYQIAVLCLVQRASILKFSAEVANLSDIEPDNEAIKGLIKQTKNIYWNYIQFKNKVYFRQVTSQIQGIEMYNQFQHIMNIPADAEILESKIEALHNYLNLLEGDTMNREMHRLTKIATFFLPASFIASMFGVGFITESTRFKGQAEWNVWTSWGIILIGGAIISLIFFWNNIFKPRKK